MLNALNFKKSIHKRPKPFLGPETRLQHGAHFPQARDASGRLAELEAKLKATEAERECLAADLAFALEELAGNRAAKQPADTGVHARLAIAEEKLVPTPRGE